MGAIRLAPRFSGSPARRMSTLPDTRDGQVPAREAWPEPVANTDAGAVLTDLILTTFRLNARFLEAAQDLATHGDLTAAGGRCLAASWTSPAAWQRSAAAWA